MPNKKPRPGRPKKLRNMTPEERADYESNRTQKKNKRVMAGNLSPLEAAFVREYLVDNNAAEASLRAGLWPGVKENSRRTKAAKLMGEKRIKNAIRDAAEESCMRVQVEVDEVLRGYKVIAFADDADAANRGIKPRDRLAALDSLAKYLGMFKQHVEHHHSGEVRTIHEFLAEIDGLTRYPEHLYAQVEREALPAAGGPVIDISAIEERDELLEELQTEGDDVEAEAQMIEAADEPGGSRGD